MVCELARTKVGSAAAQRPQRRVVLEALEHGQMQVDPAPVPRVEAEPEAVASQRLQLRRRGVERGIRAPTTAVTGGAGSVRFS
jgi:hypothetical protein